METRRLIFAILLAFGVYVAYMTIYARLRPPPPRPPSTLPEALQPAADGDAGAPATATAPDTQPAATFSFAAGQSDAPITLGGGPTDTLRVELTPRGAGLAHLWLTERNKKGRYVHRVGPRSDEPYELLHPVRWADKVRTSYTTHRIWIVELGNASWALDDLIWQVEDQPDADATRTARFSTRLANDADGAPLLRLTKSFTLSSSALLMQVSLAVENLSDRALTVVVAQDGPTGVRRESMQYEMRRVLAARREDGDIELGNLQRAAIEKAQANGEPLKLYTEKPETPLLWSALLNKFFGVFTRPVTLDGAAAAFVQSILAVVDEPTDAPGPGRGGDLRARFFTHKLPIGPGAVTALNFEVYAGPRDPDVLRAVNRDFGDESKLGYSAAIDADHSCCVCTFEPLPQWMSALLRGIYVVVRNYGIAIIILVIIIRTVLHPLSRFQQKSMFRMQDAMTRIQPKLAAIKERHANDKTKMNQEMMKLWAEENVNPAAGLVAFIPLFLQMPILVALWTAMNTEIQLRNAPFDGWWIVDLSSPDALIRFGGDGLTIPILSWIPWLGPLMFSNIPSLNLLPVLMGVSMWLQQKYMPKPAMEARMQAARGAEPAAGGPNVQDQLRQQQMMANMMSIMFPFMFYYMPSGLNLYWMATNIFGIFESLLIRKQLREEKERRAKLGPPPPGRPGMMARLFKWMAEQGSELQQKADQITEQDRRKGLQKDRDDRRKRR